jgi:hypothetical protein
VKLTDVARQRLATQHLIGTGLETPAAVVSALGAVQGQDYPGAKWAVAQRTRGATDATVEEALKKGEILRTHVLRPTWHFVRASDIRWMLALTASRIKRVMGYYNVQLGLDEAAFRRSVRAMERALRGGGALTRVELAKVLQRAGVDVAGDQRLGRVLMNAELDGLICSGPRRGNQFTYALLDERAPATASLERDEALLKLTRIYFTTRGPATPADFAWWSGLTIGDAKRGIEMASGDLAQTTVEGRAFWLGAETLPVKAGHSAHLLPNYDEFFIGLKDRSAIGERLRKSDANPPIQTFFAHLIVLDGQLVGGWTRRLTKGRLQVQLNLVTSVTRGERKALATQAARYGEFLGVPEEVAGL